MAHVLVIIAQRYNANELWPILKALNLSGHTWTTAAYEKIIIDERSRKGYRVDKLLTEIFSIEGFDGLVFVSGNPADTVAHWDDSKCNALVKQAAEWGLPMAGICASVPSLGPALRGAKVSAYPLNAVREALVVAGAYWQEVSLYTDGKIVTAENEVMAKMWARNFVCVLEGRAPEHTLEKSNFKRPSHNLQPVPELEYLRKRRQSE